LKKSFEFRSRIALVKEADDLPARHAACIGLSTARPAPRKVAARGALGRAVPISELSAFVCAEVGG